MYNEYKDTVKSKRVTLIENFKPTIPFGLVPRIRRFNWSDRNSISFKGGQVLDNENALVKKEKNEMPIVIRIHIYICTYRFD